MNKAAKLLITAAMIFFGGATSGQSLSFASGEKGKGYSKLFANINEVCNATTPLKEVASNGGLDNLMLLADKSATVGVSQIDTWQALSTGDDAIKRLQAVASLNYNMLHIVVSQKGFPTSTKCVEKNILGNCKREEPVLKLIEKDTDLKGLRVAAVGSAQLTARSYLNKKHQLGLDIVDVDAKDGKSGDALALEELRQGRVAAVLSTAAYPAGPIASIKQDQGFALAHFTLPVNSGFKVAKKNYKTMGAFNIPFLAIQNILWTRPVDPNSEIGKGVSRLKQCLTTNLSRLQEAEGFEPSWSDASLTLPDDVPSWAGRLEASSQGTPTKKR